MFGNLIVSHFYEHRNYLFGNQIISHFGEVYQRYTSNDVQVVRALLEDQGRATTEQ